MWVIRPYTGASNLTLGASRKAVRELLGPVDLEFPDGEGIIRETRDGQNPVVVYVNDALSNIIFGRHSGKVLLDDLDVFATKPSDVLAHLRSKGDLYLVWGSVLVSEVCGCALVGFDEEADPGRTLTLFRRGEWDSEIDRNRKG